MAEPTILILAEGLSDETFLKKLIESRKLGDIFGFVPRGKNETAGIGSFMERLKGLKTLRRIDEIKTILIVGDNDGDPNVSFQAIRQQVESVGEYTIPPGPRELSKKGKLPAISILMVPWDGEDGCLETLCLNAVNENYKTEHECVAKLSECVSAGNWPISKKSKMILRCLLSSVCKSEPNTPLTHAWSTDKGRPGDIFPLDNPAFDKITNHLQQIAASE